MADLLFAFDQVEINELVKDSKDDDITISIFSAIDPDDKKGKLFLAAQSRTASTASIPVGCPVPPGWNTVRPIVTKAQLVNTPSFILSAADKNELEKPDAKKDKDQLLTALEGSIANSFTLHRLSFKIKDKAGNDKSVDTTQMKLNVTE